MVKENPKQQPSSSDSRNNNILNILVIVLIICIFYSTRCMRDQIKQLETELQNTKTKLSAEPIQTKVNIVNNQKNPNCPTSENDFNSCLDKVTRCKQTEDEFADAEKQFQKLITDCAASNEKNQRINTDLEKQISDLQDNVRKLQNR